jgi:hypothetical protein
VFVQHEIRYVRNRRLLASIKLTPKEEALFEQVTQDDIDDLNTYDQIISLTETDKEVMLLDGVVTPIAVSPAAVNTKVLPYQEWKGTVTFVGGYSHIPNQEGMAWFIKEVLPLVKVDELKAINVVGSGWPQHYQQIHPKLHFMGFVDDMQAVLQGSIVMVPILTGSGMRMKILDAAATCTPIVTTTVGVEGLNFDFAPLFNSGVIFILVSIFTMLLKKDKLGDNGAKQVFAATGKQLLMIALALVSGVGMVQIMMNSGVNASGLDGMLTLISTSLVNLVGAGFPVISPLLGVLGAFVSGSCTVSGVLFGPLQYQTAELLGLNVPSIIALQMAGGAIGNMICINNVVAVAATTNAKSSEGQIIRTNLLPCLIYCAGVLLVYFVLG